MDVKPVEFHTFLILWRKSLHTATGGMRDSDVD
jgi:hypothetical protein